VSTPSERLAALGLPLIEDAAQAFGPLEVPATLLARRPGDRMGC